MRYAASARKLLALVLLVAIVGFAPVDRVSGQQSEGQLPDVTVTANRWQENAQNVPMAISAVGAEAAARLGITDPQSLANSVPGLLFNQSANLSLPFLRGVGSPAGESGDEPSVAYYVDEVYIPAAAASLASFASLGSLDRIEVAKGPQGTVFGRNATGGVVQVFTRNPSPDPALEASVGYANYATASGSLYATGALTDTLSMNLSLAGDHQNDGWGRYVVSDSPAFTGWNYGGRVKLLWTPTDKTSVLLSGDYNSLRSEVGLNFRAWPGTESFGGFAPPAGYYDNNQNLDSHTITRQSGVSLKVASDFEAARLVSITAWRFTKAVNGLDEDAGPLPIVNAQITTSENTWTQELRLMSLTGARTEWVIGAFYYWDAAGYRPLRLSGLAFEPLPYVDALGRQETSSWAGFGQARWAILPATNLTLGIRYTTDHRKLDAGGVFGGGAEVPAPNSPQSASWSKTSGRIVLDHHFTEDLMAYGGYNRGFKSGLFNPIVFPGTPIDPPVAPETLDAYTVGIKSEFLNHTLRVNTEAFYYDYKNIQVQEIVSGSTHITNAAKATIKGIDLDVSVVPLARLTITAALEVLTGHYDSFPNGLFNVYIPVGGGNCVFSGAGSCAGAALPPNYDSTTRTWDLRGNHTVYTPPFSSSLSVNYVIPAVIGPFDLTASWMHTGNYYADVDNGLGQVAPSSPNNDKQKLVNLLNVSVGWSSIDQRWQASAWARNLTGEQYWAFAAETVFLTQFTGAAPRTFGVTVRRHW